MWQFQSLRWKMLHCEQPGARDIWGMEQTSLSGVAINGPTSKSGAPTTASGTSAYALALPATADACGLDRGRNRRFESPPCRCDARAVFLIPGRERANPVEQGLVEISLEPVQ
jgi:hypothetical protein